MLDDFITSQKIAYNIFKNSVSKGRLSHAYLIETRGYEKQLDFALAFAKYLLCPFYYTNNENCGSCTQCKRIDSGNFTEISIIQPDGQMIKKEQLDELQRKFSRKALESNKKIYIINEAEKMNSSAANSILKFLEEPEEGIIAIILVNNVNQLLETIVSRCQVISLNKSNEKSGDMYHRIASFLYNSSAKIDSFCEDENTKDYIQATFDFVSFYEKRGLDILLYMPKMWNLYYNDKIKLEMGLNIMLLLYKDMLTSKMFNRVDYLLDYKEEIEKLSISNPADILAHKINIITHAIDKIYRNVNINLIMDKLILDMEELK